MTTPLRVGLVGTGYWARTVHAAGLAAHPEVRLVGIHGRSAERTAQAAAPHGATAYDDFDALLAEVDAVAFAVPPDVQAPLAIRAAESGKHLFLEKPIALELASADRLVETVDAAGVSTVIFFTQRFVQPWEDWLVEAIASKPLGGRAEWLTTQGPDSPFFDSPWRRTNGALWDVGPHMLSQLIPALGPVVEVAGARGQGDLVHLVLTHEGGRTSQLSLSFSMPAAVTRIGVEFYGDAGWTIQPDHDRDLAVAYGTAIGEWVDAARAGETRHRCDVRLGREIVEVLTRCASFLDGS